MSVIKVLRKILVFIVIIMLLGFKIYSYTKYMEEDINYEYNCISFFPSENEYENVDVIIKGKYGKSIFRGKRFIGTVTIDEIEYPSMMPEIEDKSLETTNAHRYTAEIASENPISQKINKRYGSLNAFRIGYDLGSKLWYKYGNLGYMYFDDDMTNIVILVGYDDEASVHSKENEIEKIISSKDDILTAKEYIKDNLPYID